MANDKSKSLYVVGGAALGGLAVAALWGARANSKARKEEEDCAGVSILPLVDVDEHARFFPGTFDLLPRSVRDSLARGDIAKVIVQTPQRSGERLWVQVLDGPGEESVYLGALDNDAALMPLKSGQIIAFGPEHVIEIMRGRGAL